MAGSPAMTFPKATLCHPAGGYQDQNSDRLVSTIRPQLDISAPPESGYDGSLRRPISPETKPQKRSQKPMQNRSLTSNLGIYAYAAGAIFLGLLGLAWGDFATQWQRVDPSVPLREPLAYLTALIELAAGLALLWPRTARAGALTLTVVYSVFALLWVPKLFGSLSSFDGPGNFFEEFSIVVGGAVLFARFSPAGSSISHRESLFARLSGLSAISFGIVHIYDMPGLAAWVPAYIPPSQIFWCYATTIGFFLAAVAILSGIMAPLASRLLTVEIASFEIFVWLPKLIASPHDHFIWAGNAISVAIAGATWAVSDSICQAAKRAPVPTESATQVVTHA
jgi:uncharacterized membrane protein YphA (DoxX/SURF4 family)